MTHDSTPKTIAVTTGGGDCPGLNAVIRAVVRSATHQGVRVLGIERSYGGLFGNGGVRELGYEDVRDIITRGGTILGTTNRGDPFAFVDETGQVVDRGDELIAQLKALNIEALISIGGDGSQRIAYEIYKRSGINVIAVPKTIDNDLAGTDTTFGFNTAVEIATEALDRLHSTAESHDRVMILEVMGRDAGFIALHTAIAGSADVCLIPEIPFSYDTLCQRIQARVRRGTLFSLIVVAEGARPQGAEGLLVNHGSAHAHELRYGGMGESVARVIRERLQRDVRVTVLGHIQRGGTPTAYDRVLATRFGVHAFDAYMRGERAVLVGLQGTQIVTTPLEAAILHNKQVDPEGELVHAARAVGMSMGDL